MSQCQCVGVEKLKPIFLISMNERCFWMTCFHVFCNVILLNSHLTSFYHFFSSGKVMLWNKAILMQKCKITVWFFPPERLFQAHVISLAKLKLGLFGDERIVYCVSRFKNDRCSNDAATNIRVINVNVLKPFLNLIFSHLKALKQLIKQITKLLTIMLTNILAVGDLNFRRCELSDISKWENYHWGSWRGAGELPA